MKKIRQWAKEHKVELAIICYGTMMMVNGYVVGSKAGLRTGYKRWGNITTITDPKTKAIILTKRLLSDAECYKLAGHIMSDSSDILEGLSNLDVLK